MSGPSAMERLDPKGTTTMRRPLLPAATLTVLALATAGADTPTPATPAPSVHFEDQFQEDSRPSYQKIGKESDLKEGRLALPSGAVAIRKIEMGSVAGLTVRWRFATLDRHGDRDGVRWGFIVNGGVALIEIKRRREKDRIAGSTSFGYIPPGKSQVDPATTREFPLPDGSPDGDWTARYRHGLIAIENGGRRVALSYAPAPGVDLGGFFVASDASTNEVERVLLAADARPHPLSDEDYRVIRLGAEEEGRLQREGRFRDAADRIEPIIRLYRERYGEDSYYVVANRHQVGAMRAQNGDLATGRAVCLGALEGARRLLGEEHPEVAAIYSTLGDLKRVFDDDMPGAQGDFEKALAIREAALGRAHLATAESLHSLGLVAHRRGDRATALARYQEALEVHRKATGPAGAEAIASLGYVRDLYREWGRYETARVYLEEAVALCRKAPDHPALAEALTDLAALLQDLGDYPAVRGLLEEALAIRRRRLGPEHAETAAALVKLGRLM
jgi:tetratricopeptide (TPR) repeat protein